MATNPPVIAYVTATIDSITCSLVPPIDPTYDHTVAVAYDFIDGTVAATLDPAPDPSFTFLALPQNRTYCIVAYTVDTGGEFSTPAVTMPVATTNYEAPANPVPDLAITDVYQVGSGTDARVIIEYSLIKADPPITGLNGDLVRFEYSFNGTFTDAAIMTPDFDHPDMEPLNDLEFLPSGVIIPPQHKFVWDVSKDVSLDTIHTYLVRLQGRLIGINTPIRSDDVDVDLSQTQTVIGSVVSGQTLSFSLFMWNNGTPVTGATVTVTEIYDPAGTDHLVGSIVLTAGAQAGQYNGTFVLNVAWPTGLWRMVYNGFLGVPATFQVNDTAYFFNLSASAVSMSMLTDPTKCLVYGTLYGVDGTPLAGTEVTAIYKREPSRYDRVGTLSSRVVTDSNGFFIIPLLRGADVVLNIPHMNYGEVLKITDTVAAEFRTLQVNQPSLLTRGPFGHVVPQ